MVHIAGNDALVSEGVRELRTHVSRVDRTGGWKSRDRRIDPDLNLSWRTIPRVIEKNLPFEGAALEAAALPVAMTNLKKIYDAGILVTLGTDSGATPVRVQGFAEHMELVLMVQAGLTPLQAISVATKNAAQLLRIADDYGTLEPGKKANFIVLERDPTQDIRNTQTIRAVWKNGVRVSDGPL